MTWWQDPEARRAFVYVLMACGASFSVGWSVGEFRAEFRAGKKYVAKLKADLEGERKWSVGKLEEMSNWYQQQLRAHGRDAKPWKGKLS